MVILVIDATKGIQTQTAEGIIIAELVTTHVIVLLNKIDLVPEAERETRVNLLKTRIGKVLSGARFNKIDFIPFSTKTKVGDHFYGFEALMHTLSKVDVPKRNLAGAPLLMSVDHCFTLKGKGSVATGTILRGSLAPNQMVEVVGHVSPYKIKSIEMFKTRMQQVSHGDRAGVLIPNLDSTLLERGLICHPGSIYHTDGIIVTLNKIRYYKHEIESGMKLHISIGHSTVLGKIMLFEDTAFLQSIGLLANDSDAKSDQTDGSSKTREIRNPYGEMTAAELAKLDLEKREFSYLKTLTSERPFCLALIHLERSIPVPSDSIYIASKLDADIHTTSCRLAFHGKVISSFTQDISSTSTSASISSATSSSKKDLREVRLQDLKVITTKEKSGAIDRIVDDYVLIGRSLFKKETKMALFIGLEVTVNGKKGVIDSSFGASGKFKVRFSSPVAKSLPLDAPIILILKKQKFSTNTLPAKK